MFDIFAPQTITNNKMAIQGELWRLQERAEQLGSFYALNLVLRIFKDNPTLGRLKLSGDITQEYDDNGTYDSVELDSLVLFDSQGENMPIFTLDNACYTTIEKYDGDGKDEPYGWFSFDAELWDCKDYFEDLIKRQGCFRLDIKRETVEPFLGESYSFEDAMFKVFGWVNHFTSEAEEAITHV